MSKLALIITQSEAVWIPPRSGEICIAVEQYTQNFNDDIIHFCCDSCDRFTYIDGNCLPAIYTIFKNGVRNNVFETVKLRVSGPVRFYFTNSKNERMNVDTPKLRLLIEY